MTSPAPEIPAAPTAPAAAEISQKLAVRVFGVGGAGCAALAQLGADDFGPPCLFALNTDSRDLDQSALPQKVLLGAKRLRGLGAGADPDEGRAAAEDDVEQLRALCKDASIVFILAGLGAGTGTGAAPVLAQAAKEAGALVLAVVTLPFEFEGARRQRQAQLGLHQLKSAADAVICLPNQKLFKTLDGKTSLWEGFQISNRLVAEGVRGVWRPLSRPGLINIDFANLCAATRGRHAESCFATAEAAGEQRATQIVEQLLAHPLLEGGKTLAESDTVLLSLVGGSDLTLAEVDRLMAQINRHCEKAQVIMGAAIDEALAGRLSVTIIASRHQRESGAGLEMSTARSAAPPTLSEFIDPTVTGRPPSRFVAPAPDLTAEKKEQLLARQGGRSRKKISRLQRELPLEIVSKGRFEKSEPTLRHGEDLDVPTYIRRGVALN